VPQLQEFGTFNSHRVVSTVTALPPGRMGAAAEDQRQAVSGGPPETAWRWSGLRCYGESRRTA
jgi:hypothetical protein